MKFTKTTHGQLRRENRQMLLRAVYTGMANNRADLAQGTGLAKPTVSDLVSGLIEEGFLVETGLGQSTDEGGKRPRLLQFVPNARHVVGLSIDMGRILGVLANLDGSVLFEHYQDIAGATGQDVMGILCQVINGLLSQLDAPLLCIGIGVTGIVENPGGIVSYAPHLGWKDVSLASILSDAYKVPVYVANGPELAALAQFAFNNITKAQSLATIHVSDSIGIGYVMEQGNYHSGTDIGQMRIVPGSDSDLEKYLAWQFVQERAAKIPALRTKPDVNYLYIRQAIEEGDADAIALQEELAGYLAHIYAWVIGLLRPDHITLAGSIADLGEPMMRLTLDKTKKMVLPNVGRKTACTLDSSSNLVSVGAVAQTLQQGLGLF